MSKSTRDGRRIVELERLVEAQTKTIEVLMKRVEGVVANRFGPGRDSGGSFAIFEQNLLLEKLVAARTRELEGALEELRLAQSQLVQAQKLEAIGALAAGVAHEINTPTQYVSDNVSFLDRAFVILGRVLDAARSTSAAAPPEVAELAPLRAALSQSRLEYVVQQIPRSIEQSVDGLARIASIVGALKEFSHPSSAQKEPVDLAHAIETTVTVARGEWKYVADIDIECDREMDPVPAYRQELSQVVLNILVNAAHAIGEARHDGADGKGHIRITCRREGEFAVVCITDNGAGIPAEIRERIFDPFFTTKPVGKGTGQGLAIAYDTIVEKHGGRIEVESEVGVGTTFVIHLPYAAQRVAA